MNQAIADATGLNRTDAQCIDIVTRSGPITPGALAERLGLTAGAVTISLDRLESRGWVSRRHDTADRRRILVERNEKKVRQVRELYGGLQKATLEVTKKYSPEQIELIAEFLRRISAVVADHRKSLPR